METTPDPPGVPTQSLGKLETTPDPLGVPTPSIGGGELVDPLGVVLGLGETLDSLEVVLAVEVTLNPVVGLTLVIPKLLLTPVLVLLG